MALTKRKLKGLIEYSDLRNEAGLYNEDDVVGVSTSKEMIVTKANLDGVNLHNYKLFPPNSFAFVADTSRRGDKIALTYNNTSRTYIVSTWYVVFNLSEEAKKVLFPDYLFLYFNRSEFDRYARTNSWGSAREYFWFQDMEDIMIELPPIDIQRKYVDVYLSLQKNLAAYQSKVDELKLVCDGYIENLRRNMPCEKIGGYINECNERNVELKITNVQGVESSGTFAETKANTNGLDFSNYKIVKEHQFAYNPSRINLGSIALRDESDCIVSPMYIVFEIISHDVLLPEYLMLWLSRSEFLRSTLFYASGSVRDTFNFTEMSDVLIPIPTISIQKDIIKIYRCYIERQRIASQLKEQLNNLCPILIKGSLQTNN